MVYKTKTKKFDPGSPCLVLAPHLEYPLRNGADILIDRKWSYFSKYVPFVDIVGKNDVNRYENGQLVDRKLYENVDVTKKVAALKSILKQSHYLFERFITNSVAHIVETYLLRPEYQTVVFSFIYTAAILKRTIETNEKLYLIETHNDEWRWFSQFMKKSLNPGVLLSAFFSKRWLTRFLREHEYDFLYVHVSKTDRDGYLRLVPFHRNIIIPVGVEEENLDVCCLEEIGLSEKVRLLFVGSLSVGTNFEALKFFGDKFFPILKENFGSDLEILIAGSRPSVAVERLCGRMRWRLLGNVSDQELRYLYSISMFSILPFQYTTGGKLKLLKSLSNGVPYVATPAIGDQIEEVLYPCLISSDAKEWLTHIRTIRGRGITESERVALIDQARKKTWSSVAYNMFESLCYGSFTSKDTKSNDS
jgi:hypothetical protein